MSNSKRPGTATVFGILNIIFGAATLIFGLKDIHISFDMGVFNGILSISGVLISALLLVAGIFLIMNKRMAIAMNRCYAIASLCVSAFRAVYLITTFGVIGFMGAVISILIMGLYPVLILLLIVKNKEIVSYYIAES